ncbi:MAG: hypothetical protein IJ272_08390 [Clostridia bacterium]|nr:hypothetical protein [Clostridia bacterium]
MKKVLVATRNMDKFDIVVKMLNKHAFKNYEYLSLNDINGSIAEEKEQGDITNRAINKALVARKSIRYDEFDYVIGIDDGIEMKGKIIENVKNYIGDIINNNYLIENERVNIVRAYSFVDKEMNHKEIVTKIPFKYKKSDRQIEPDKMGYPLSYVLTPINSDIPVAELNKEDSNNYYLSYSAKEIENVGEYFNVMQ